jgi:hypothetical protein
LTDDELYQLKGGDLGLAKKVLVGFGFGMFYLLAGKRNSEFLNFNVSGILP